MEAKPFRKEKHNSLKKFMHPRNPYRTPPSFKRLAIAYPSFRKHCSYDLNGRVHLDFKNPSALRALTTCLLQQDFGLNVEIPDDRLVPALPLRLNYLLWIEDMLLLMRPRQPIFSDCTGYSPVVGYDIGAGAACICPLLGCKKFCWSFLATEKDDLSYTYAKDNIVQNKLGDSILIKKEDDFFNIVHDPEVQTFLKKARNSQQSSNLAFENEDESKMEEKDSRSFLIDFTMCNPPFFSSEDELDSQSKSRSKERSEPTSAPTGSVVEKVVEGGEVAFISQMMRESVEYKHLIRIFTSLIGQKKHVASLKKLLTEEISPSHYKITEFCQGRTARWGISWTFDPTVRLENALSKKEKVLNKPLTLILPRTTLSICSVAGAWEKISLWLKDLKIKPNLFKSKKYFIGANLRVYKSTWLHQRKKRREDARKQDQKLGSIINRQSENASEEPSPKKIKLSETFSTVTLNDDGEATAAVATAPQEGSGSKASSGLECILKCNILLKQTQGLITLELVHHGGSQGKEAMNGLMQYFKNRLRADS